MSSPQDDLNQGPLPRGPGKDGKSTTRKKQKNPRKPISCGPCRRSKLRCDRQLPCSACQRRTTSQLCRYTVDGSHSPSAGDSIIHEHLTPAPTIEHTHREVSLPTPVNREQRHSRSTRFARPAAVDHESQDFTRDSWDSMWQRPLRQRTHSPSYTQPPGASVTSESPSMGDLVAMLPPAECRDYLMIQFFTLVAPMFRILHEDTFQKRYNTFTREGGRTDDLAWLSLLFSMLSVSVHVLEENDPVLGKVRERIPHAQNTAALSCEYRRISMVCLSRDNFMFNYHLVTLESILVLAYGISHFEGVDAAWTLLGLALNMGIALKCNASRAPREANDASIERRRQCWIGVLSLHTCQVLLFPDIDLGLLKISDRRINDSPGIYSLTKPTGNSVMDFKLRLFELSDRISKQTAPNTDPVEAVIESLDAEIAKEQHSWDIEFLREGLPGIFDMNSYAHWCLLQVYAYQLYLLLHRPFCHSRPVDGKSQYRTSSRRKCIESGAALLDIQRQYVELPRLRHHRWTMYGMIASCCVHGAMALASCLLEENDGGLDMMPYYSSFDAAVSRIEILQSRSTIYAKAYPILHHLQMIFRARQQPVHSAENIDFKESFENWMNTIQWFDSNSANWDFWDDLIDLDGI